MEEILREASKVAEQAEVFAFESEETPVSFEANRLKLLQTRQEKGLALRIVKNGRIGLTATTRRPDPRAMVARAVELAQFGTEAKFELPGRVEYPVVETFDPAVADLSAERLIEMGRNIIDALVSYNGDLACEVSLSKEVLTVRVLNTQGGEATYKKSVLSIGFEGTLIRGTDMLFIGDGDSSCHLIENYMDLAQTGIRQLRLAENTAKVATGSMPVVFTPYGVASALLAPLRVAFNGRLVLQGSSPLVGRQGQRLFHPTFSLWDDAALSYRPSSASCDDEGMPRRRVSLVENGVIGEFLYDLQTAGLAGTTSTGSAARSLETLPSPATSNLVIAEGDVPFDDIVAGIKEGLVVEHLMGASQGNTLGGEFSGNVLLGYKVENGRLIGRVKDTMVSGNIYEALKNVAAMSKESRWVGSLRTPAICCTGLSVAARS